MVIQGLTLQHLSWSLWVGPGYHYVQNAQGHSHVQPEVKSRVSLISVFCPISHSPFGNRTSFKNTNQIISWPFSASNPSFTFHCA